MSYTKQNFVSGQVLKAEHLNNMENGIEANASAVTSPSAQIGAALSDTAGGAGKSERECHW